MGCRAQPDFAIAATGPGTRSSPRSLNKARRQKTVPYEISVTKAEGDVSPPSDPGEESTEEVPDSAEHLQTILQAHGIDTSTWGDANTKTVADLFGEVRERKCVLKRKKDISGQHSLERRVRILQAKIRASISQGSLRYLKCRGIDDKRRTEGEKRFPNRDCARKMCTDAIAKKVLNNLLLDDFHLPSELQAAHITTESFETLPLQDNPGHGLSLPGLRTRFSFTVAWLVVKDVHAPGIKGKIGLPDGTDFQTTDGKKTRFWTWATPSIEDSLSAEGRSTGRLSIRVVADVS